MNPLASHPDRTALLGVVLTLPALALVGQGLAFSLGGWTGGEAFLATPLAHPAVIVGGIAAAVALNLAAVLRIHFAVEPEAATAAFTVRRHWANLAVLAVGGALAGLILAYVIVENAGAV